MQLLYYFSNSKNKSNHHHLSFAKQYDAFSNMSKMTASFECVYVCVCVFTCVRLCGRGGGGGLFQSPSLHNLQSDKMIILLVHYVLDHGCFASEP